MFPYSSFSDSSFSSFNPTLSSGFSASSLLNGGLGGTFSSSLSGFCNSNITCVNPCSSGRRSHARAITLLINLGRELATTFSADLSFQDRSALQTAVSQDAITWMNRLQDFQPNLTTGSLSSSPAFQLGRYFAQNPTNLARFRQVVSTVGTCALKGAIAAFLAAFLAPSFRNIPPLIIFIVVLVEGMQFFNTIGLGGSQCDELITSIASNLNIDLPTYPNSSPFGWHNIFTTTTVSGLGTTTTSYIT